MNDPKNRATRYHVGGFNMVYDTGEAFWVGPAIDVSESGLFIETHHELAPGVRVTMVPEGPDDGDLPFEIVAEVVRVSEYQPDVEFDRVPGIAFRFVDMPLEQRESVRKYLKDKGVPTA